MGYNFKKINGGNLDKIQDLEGGFSLTRLFTGNLFNDDYVADFKTQKAWDVWFDKIKKRHINLFVFSKKDPNYKPDKKLEKRGIDPYSDFLIPPLLKEYNFSDIINILKDYYNFENGNWNTYKGDNIGRQFREENIQIKDHRWLTSGRVQTVIQYLLNYLNKRIKAKKGDKEEYEGGIRMIRQSLEEPPFKTFKTKIKFGKTQEQQIKKIDKKLRIKDQQAQQAQQAQQIQQIQQIQPRLYQTSVDTNTFQKTNEGILEEVKKIREEINKLTLSLQQTNTKIASNYKQPQHITTVDRKIENKIKEDKIRSEIDDLVKQESAIIKSLFDTTLSRANTLFRDYL